VKSLCALPGVGTKTAARLILDLSSKVPVALLTDAPAAAFEAAAEGEHPQRAAALDMLSAMGLPATRASQVLAAAAAESADVMDDPARWVRAALRHLG
jgi:Holliday junction resolvasome RuvABC DNA-binding subunit